VGAINIGLKYLFPDGRPVAFGSTGTHAAWVKLVIPSLGATPLAEIQVFGNTSNTVSRETLCDPRDIIFLY
jgi:hypothetical protein